MEGVKENMRTELGNAVLLYQLRRQRVPLSEYRREKWRVS